MNPKEPSRKGVQKCGLEMSAGLRYVPTERSQQERIKSQKYPHTAGSLMGMLPSRQQDNTSEG